MKPGIKTTEFWLSLAAGLAGIGLIVYGVVSEDSHAVTVGGGLAAFAGVGYSASRGLAKL